MKRLQHLTLPFVMLIILASLFFGVLNFYVYWTRSPSFAYFIIIVLQLHLAFMCCGRVSHMSPNLSYVSHMLLTQLLRVQNSLFVL